MKVSNKLLPLLIILSLSCVEQSLARQDEEERRSGPPPEAFAACESKQAGDQAQFTGRRGETVTGTCESGKDGKLFLKPDHPPGQAGPKDSSHSPEQQDDGQRRQQGPPPEAFAACESKQAGDQAQFIGRRGETVTGTCENGKDGRLFLKPDHSPGQAGPKH